MKIDLTSLLEALKTGETLQFQKLVHSADLSLLDQKIYSEAENRIGWTLLHFAVFLESAEKVKILLEKGVNVNVQEDKDDRTPLMMAVTSGNLNITEMLVEAHANVNIRQLDGDSPLLRAASEGMTDIVKVLLNAGADIRLNDNLGWTALLWASTNGHKDIVQMLVDTKIKIHEEETNADRTALLIAASLGNTEITKLLLLGKFDSSTPDLEKALMAAATSGHFEIVELLRKFQNK